MSSAQAIPTTWHDRVVAYVVELESVCTRLDLLLEKFDPQKQAAQPSEIEASTGELAAAVVELESMVAQRESLLADEEAPQPGSTLIEKLNASPQGDEGDLADRCKRVASTITNVHQRIIAVFVCQYHLADLTKDILAILAGSEPSGTYERGSSRDDHRSGAIRQSEGTETSRGGLFNEAG